MQLLLLREIVLIKNVYTASKINILMKRLLTFMLFIKLSVFFIHLDPLSLICLNC